MDAAVTVALPQRGADSRFDLGILDGWSEWRLAAVERALSDWVPADAPAGLGDAMRYAVVGGGKRLRPLLVLAACEAVRGDERAALRAACAVELIHAYSLVHDDLPCMDDDVLRRGKPTVHVRFGEARALLAGDALQALAFELLTPDDDSIAPAQQAALCRLLTRAAGHRGMAGGQAIDLASIGQPLDESQLRRMHSLKTGALLECSVAMGAACGTVPPAAAAALSRYGTALGLAFQVVDDILDATADTATLGKTAGKDAAQQKPTYVSVLGLARSREHAQQLLGQALAALDASGLDAEGSVRPVMLRALAEMVVNRDR